MTATQSALPEFMVEPFKRLDGASILVTGGTGSFGQALVSQILRHGKPSRLIIYSRDEQKQYSMAQAFPPEVHKSLRYFIGDVRDFARLKRATVGVDTIVHAAALKHVPVAEYNPIEAINTNIIGAENVINAAIDNKVSKIMALSTDKASNPINLYGATKLCSDKLFVAANNLSGGQGTDFGVVRYGNVLGSRGSVVPLFRKLVADKVDALPITHPRMTRFWITLEQGVHFVLRCMHGMKGGEIFVPKIPSMKLVDLVDAIAPGYPTKIVGIRPGEKLHEVMVTVDDALNTIEFDTFFTIRPTGILKQKSPLPTFAGVSGRPVGEDFQYRSDLNDQWLSKEQLIALLGT
ncbi:MAG: UDP-N-acetylglucosamine 4,6-dehydratase (inverting) [Hyphomicrobium sp.]